MTQAPARRAVPTGLTAAGPGPARALPSPPGSDGAQPSRRLWAGALVVYTAVVALVVAWPTPVDAGAHRTLSSTLGTLHAMGLPGWIDYRFVESAANVAMFVPLGFMVTRLCRRWWWGLLVPAALSGAAELGQHLLRPERYATWADLAANTGGAALGTLAAVLLTARGRSASTPAAHRPARTPHPAPSPPR